MYDSLKKNNDMTHHPCECLQTFEAIVDAHDLKLELNKEVEENVELPKKLPPCVAKGVLTWIVETIRPHWPRLAIVLSRLIEIFGTSNTIDPLWTEILTSKELTIGRILETLCIMADFCFPTEIDSTQKIRYDYSISPELWSVLLRGLDNPVSAERTKALFLIQKVSTFVAKHESVIMKNFDVSKAQMVPFIRKNEQTRPSSTAAFRQIFFITMQSLENKKKNMVMPALNWVFELVGIFKIQNCQGYFFDKKWMQCMYKRMLTHNELAVRKAGFREILSSDLHIFDESFIDFITRRLRKVIWYEFDYSEEQSPEIVQQLAKFFWRSERDKMPWIKVFIRSISKLSWSTVSLHWVLKSFVIDTDEQTRIVHNSWKEEELRNMNKLVTSNLSIRYVLSPETRSVLHEMLRVYISPDDNWKDVGLVTTAIQNIAGLEKVEVPATHLQEMIVSEDAQDYVIRQCNTLWPEQSSESFAKNIIALIYSNMIFSDADCRARRRLGTLFEETNRGLCRKSPELPSRVRVLELASYLMKKSKVLNFWECPLLKLKRFLLRRMATWLEIVESLPTHRSILPEHTKITIALIKYNAADRVEYLNDFYEECVLLVAQEPAAIRRDLWIFALRVIYTYHQRYYHKFRLIPPSLSKSQLQLVIKYFQTNILDSHSYDKKAIEKCCKAIARLIGDYFEARNPTDQNEIALFLDELRFVIERAPRVTILIAIKLIAELLQPKAHHQKLNDENTASVFSLVHDMCDMVFQFESTTKEVLSLRLYAQLVSQSFFLNHEGSSVFAAKWVNQLIDEGNDMPEIKTAFISGINEPETGIIFLESILRCLFNGVAPNIELRIENLACGLYGPQGEVDFPEDKIIVAYTIIVMMDLLERVVRMKSAFREKLLEGLLDVLKNLKNVVYRENSAIHKIKCRTYQALLAIVSYLDENETRRLHDEICTLLVVENNQATVRMLQEWLIVRIYTTTSMGQSIWKIFKEGMENHSENIICIVSVTLQIAKVLKSTARFDFIKNALDYLMPYSIGYRFRKRICNKIHWVLLTLYSMLPIGYKFRFSNAVKNLRLNLHEKNKNKGANDLVEDFWAIDFGVNGDLSLEMIFEHVPRLMGFPLEERIEVAIFEALMDPTAYEVLDVFSSEKWENMKATKPSVGRGDDDDNDEMRKYGIVIGVQKKLRQFATSGLVTDEFSDDARIEYERNIARKSSSGIIVVATLFTRLRHLGQLAKTCEVFAVKELVIGNSKYIDRQAFARMSSSAEDVLSITEVRKRNLKNFLIEQRSKGWKVVGTQQIDSSTNILDTEFNKKTILLLGNERKGIPADLLPLCDMTVMIPGNGVIRSLNIQVAGAICTWQYAKQHTFSQF